ncbi:hypothetical protein AVEN_71173-1 [Araneus ventricosus]|uniref:Reverse transcriptase domain-containing protein n=1 Tax=Araneus ventricosus TaxID=182803 RepID=A0A4Y2SU14_ARAVE|nr:hypothetical protein AVEN_71173-1 [Araneus ventricosus]
MYSFQTCLQNFHVFIRRGRRFIRTSKGNIAAFDQKALPLESIRLLHVPRSYRPREIICLTETWLCEQIDSSDLFDDRYLVFRKDRDSFTSSFKRGGGVIIAIKKNISVSQIHFPLIDLECIWISDKLKFGKKLLLCVLYLPPASGIDRNDLCGEFGFSGCLLFADDLKFFRQIRSNADAALLPNDLDNLYEWCIVNKLLLHVEKCSILSFTRKSQPIFYSYQINDILLRRCRSKSVTDLGVTFHTRLDFTQHIHNIVSMACTKLGFIKFNTRHFSGVLALKKIIRFDAKLTLANSLEYLHTPSRSFKFRFPNNFENIKDETILKLTALG